VQNVNKAFVYITDFTWSLIGKSQKNVLAGAHKRFERRQHTEKYLPGLKMQNGFVHPYSLFT
jgi:hypothetical protein